MAKYFKIAALLSILVCFANAVYAQSNEQLTNTIMKYYNKKHFTHSILYFEGKWYFVTAINPDYFISYDKYGIKIDIDAKSKAVEANLDFFSLIKTKNYYKYTFFPEDITNVPNVAGAYNILKKNQSKYFEMPQIGSVRVSESAELSLFAKAISNDPDTSSQINTGSTIVGNTEKSSNTTTAANSVQMKENNDAVNSMPSQDSKSVTLVVYGTANNENEAIKVALRSAIEQAYGTFVSANTQIVNDELTKDEIVSVTSGNIENYSLISSDKDSDGKTSVSVKATVSIGKLLQFAQSKGATTELAGAAFAMNMKMKKLNKKNENEALIQMYNKLLEICDLNLFDFTITTSDPHLVNGFTDFYSIPVTIGITPNKNYENLLDEFFHTLEALSLTKIEAEEYEKANISTFRSHGFILRNKLDGYNMKGVNILDVLKDKFVLSSCSFSIKDNLGNSSVPVKQTYLKNYHDGRSSILNCYYPIYYKSKKKETGKTERSAGGYEYQVIDKIYTVYGMTISSNNNPNKFFLGKKIDSSFDKDDWRDFIYIVREDHHKAFGELHIFEMDINGRSYNFGIRLYYTEEELSRLNSITIEPIKPSEVKCSTVRLE